MAHVIQIHSQLPTRQITAAELVEISAGYSQLPTRQITIKVAKLIYIIHIIKKQIQFYPYFYMLAQRVLLSTAYNEDINKG